MKEEKKLIISMTIFTIIIFIIFALIIINEKTSLYSVEKIKQKLTNYTEKKYPNINFEYQKITKQKSNYSMKVVSSRNKNWYFLVTYQNKKIKDTYQKDYVEGASLLTHIRTQIKKEIKQKTKKDYQIKIPYTLNQYSKKMQEKIITETKLSTLPIYSLQLSIKLKWNPLTITKNIQKEITSLENVTITPHDYTIILQNETNQKQTITLKNIKKEEIENKNFLQTISSYINT